MIKKEINDLVKDYPNCIIEEKYFEPGDLDGKDLIFLATDDPALHRDIKIMAGDKNILVNTADKPELCDFYLSSVVQKGHLKIAISTNGMSPTLAKRIKEMLSEVIPEDINTSLGNLNQIRSTLKGDFEHKTRVLNQITTSWINPDQELNKRKVLLKRIVLVLLIGTIGFILGLLYNRMVPI